jgi:hypothetical protein
MELLSFVKGLSHQQFEMLEITQPGLLNGETEEEEVSPSDSATASNSF